MRLPPMAGYEKGKLVLSQKLVAFVRLIPLPASFDFVSGTNYLQGLSVHHLSRCLDIEPTSRTQLSHSLSHHLWLVPLSLT